MARNRFQAKKRTKMYQYLRKQTDRTAEFKDRLVSKNDREEFCPFDGSK